MQMQPYQCIRALQIAFDVVVLLLTLIVSYFDQKDSAPVDRSSVIETRPFGVHSLTYNMEGIYFRLLIITSSAE